LKVKQVSHLKVGQHITIRESKTGKDNILVVNKAVFKALRLYMDILKPEPDDFVFASRKGKNALTIQAVNLLVKKWTAAINLRGNYGAHTFRKSWGYIQRVNFGTSFALIARRYNHSDPSTTMRYIGIQSHEVCNILMNEIG
jgi:integrase